MALINMGRFPSSRREIVLMYNEQERCLTEKNLELVEMKNKLQEKEKRIKELEDKFGITQKKEWSIRKLKWWFLWLEKNDTDVYEYMMKYIYHSIIFEGKLSKCVELQKKELRKVRVPDPPVNIYGINFVSGPSVNRESVDMVLSFKYGRSDFSSTLTKRLLIDSYKGNGFKVVKHGKGKEGVKTLIHGLIKYNHLLNIHHDELTIDELKELIKIKENRK